MTGAAAAAAAAAAAVSVSIGRPVTAPYRKVQMPSAHLPLDGTKAISARPRPRPGGANAPEAVHVRLPAAAQISTENE